jgi:hypothetical protein
VDDREPHPGQRHVGALRQPHCTYMTVAVDGSLGEVTLHRLPNRA